MNHLVDSCVAGRIEISAQLGGCQIRGEIFLGQPSPRSAGDALNGRGWLLGTQRKDDKRVVGDGWRDVHGSVLSGDDKVERVSGDEYEYDVLRKTACLRRVQFILMLHSAKSNLI